MMKRLLIGEKYDGHMLLGKADSLGQHVAADGCCQDELLRNYNRLLGENRDDKQIEVGSWEYYSVSHTNNVLGYHASF